MNATNNTTSSRPLAINMAPTWVQRFRALIGYAAILPWRKERFAPGSFTPRFDKQGRIYMLIAPDDSK